MDSGQVEDVKDGLEQLEALLLEAEGTLGSGAENRSLVHRMFRFAHNVKGALGMMGLEEAQALVHHLESSLDEVRQGQGPLSQACIDACLTSISSLREFLDGGILAQELLNLIPLFASPQGEAPASSPVTLELASQLTEEERKLLGHAQSAGLAFYRIEKVVSGEISESAYRQLPIYEDIMALGTVLVTLPRYTELKHDQEEEILQIIFASEKSEDELSNSIFDTFSRVEIAPPSQGTSSPAPNRFLESPSLGQTVSESSPKTMRILIVEDEVTTRLTLHAQLKRYGECVSVVDGHEALVAYLLALEEGEPFQLVCLDIMMPSVNGDEVLKRIRAAESDRDVNSLSHSARVVMVTGASPREHALTSFKLGCDGYVTKPIQTSKLHELIGKLFPNSSAGS